VTATLALANIYNIAKTPSKSLQLVDELKRSNEATSQATNLASIVYVEVGAHLLKGDTAAAEAAINSALQVAGSRTNVLRSTMEAFFDARSFTNAVRWSNRLLEIEPENANALIKKSYAAVQAAMFTEAIDASTQLIASMTNSPSIADTAHFNRAIAYLQVGELDKAQADYEQARQSFTNSFQIFYGLGEIAYRKETPMPLFAITKPISPLSKRMPTSRLSSFSG